MADDNYVEIRIRARDDARATLDELKAQIDELRHKTAEAMIGLDDKDALAKLLAYNVELDKLDKRLANPKITAEGMAAVEARIVAIDAGLDKLNAKVAAPKVALEGDVAALARIEEIKLRLDALQAKVTTALVEVKDPGAHARLLALRAQLDAIGKRVADPRITIEGVSRAEAQIAAVGLSLDKLNESGTRTGNTLTRFFTGGSSIWLKIAAGLLPLLGPVLGLAGAFAGAAAGIVAFGAIAGPVITNAVSATSALVGANSAFDASAGLVHTAITTNAKDLGTYTSAMQGLTPVQQQVEKMLGQQGTRWQDLTRAQRNAAVSLSQDKDALKAMLPDQAKALAQLIAQGQAYNNLTPAQRAFGAGLSVLDAQWQKLQQKITPALLTIAAGAMRQIGGILTTVGKDALLAAPGVGHLVTTLLSLVNNVFRVLAPAIAPGLSVINELTRVLGGTLLGILRVLASSLLATAGPLKTFLAGLGTALGALLRSIGIIAVAMAPISDAILGVITSLLTAVSPVMVQVAKVIGTALHAIAPLFPPIARAVGIMAQAFSGFLVSALRALMPSLTQLSAALAKLFTALTPLLPSLARLSAVFLTALQAIIPLLPPVIRLTADLVNFITAGAIPAVKAAVQMIGVFRDIAAVIAVMINWIGRAIGWLLQWVTSMRNVKDAAKTLWDSVKAAVVIAAAGIEAVMRTLWSSMTATWNGITASVRSAVSIVVGLARTLWQSMAAAWNLIVNAVSTGANTVVSFMRSLPGRILSALGNLGSLLYNAGRSVIGGLISGIESMAGAVASAVSGIAHKVAGFFGLSPAKWGPLAGGGAPFIRGQHFAADLAAGMMSGESGVGGAAGRLARRAAITPGAGGYGSAGGGRLELVVTAGTADPLMREIIRSLRFEIRAGAGGGPDSVQKYLGHAA
jgi:phage-related protein